MQSGAQNAVIGDSDEPTQLPVTEVPEEVMTEEKKMAQYSKTAEYKRLEDFMKARIEFYQSYLPDGTQVDALKIDNTQMAAHWIAANVVIREFKGVIDAYARAQEVVSNAGQQG